MITDKNIAWRRKVLYIPYFQWRNTTTGATSQPVAGAPFGGQAIAAAGATAYEGGIMLPRDVDPNFELGFRIFGAAATALTDLTSVTYLMLAQFSALNAVAVAATAAGALDTIIGATTVTAGAGMRHVSNRGVKNKGFLTRTQILAGAIIQWSLALTAATGTIANTAIVHALLMDYMPMTTRQPHRETDDNWTTDDIF